MSDALVLFGLGSNLGDRAAYLAQAVKALASSPEIGLRDGVCAGWYESPALLPDDAPAEWDRPFLNTVCAGRSAASPREVLRAVQGIERQLGRQERGRWGPREIDIDLLAYGQEVIEEAGLVIPHPGVLTRDFVLLPLAEILPEWRYPGAGAAEGNTAGELAVALERPKAVRVELEIH